MVVINAKKYTCHWCGSALAYKCTCGYYTCSDCQNFPEQDHCVHKKYEQIKSDNWKVKKGEWL